MRFRVFRHLYQRGRGDLVVAEGQRNEQKREDDNEQSVTWTAAELQAAAATAGPSLSEVAAVITRLRARLSARSLAVPLGDMDVNRSPYACVPTAQ